MYMISLVPFVHTALEFRLQVLCRAMCLSKQPIHVTGKLWLCNKHGIRKSNSIIAYRFFSSMAYTKYGFNFDTHTFVKKQGEDGNGINGNTLCFLTLVNNPGVDQELLNLLFNSLEIASGFYNKMYEVMDLNLASGGYRWYRENDVHYYDINSDYITKCQRFAYKNPILVWNKTVKGIEALSYFAERSSNLIKTLDDKLVAFYVAGELKRKK